MAVTRQKFFLFLIGSLLTGSLFVSPVNAGGGPHDFDVVYIKQTPLYPRYCLSYIADLPPVICSGKETEKHQPDKGEKVTFSAKVINKETKPGAGSFNYQWFIDGTKVSEGVSDTLWSGQSVMFSYDWAWEKGDHKVKFMLSDASDPSWETYTTNNQLEDYTNALTFRFHVEKSVYDKFNNVDNIAGTKSFEDWVQYQLAAMQKLLNEGGSKEKLRVDEIIIENDKSLPRGSTHAPEDINWDGRWGFETDEWMSDPGRIPAQVKQIRFDLIHEWGHQIGLIDVYNLNYDGNNIKTNYIMPQCKDFPGGDILSSPVYKNCVYGNPDLLLGIMSSPDKGKFVAFETQALNSSLGFRRGYFGEYLYDIPSQNTFKFLDKTGNLLPKAEINFYQSSSCGGGRSMPAAAVSFGPSDQNGKYQLPNKSVKGITTATGHTLKDNPFGQIDVNGCNGIFLIKIAYNGQTDYQWFDISKFNLQFWAGHTQDALYEIKTNILRQVADGEVFVSSAVTLPGDALLDLSGGIQNFQDAYTGGDLTGRNFKDLVTIGGSSVAVGKKVRMESTDNILLTVADTSGVSVTIPNHTAVLAPSGWDGKIQPPKNISGNGIAPAGFSLGSAVFEVGSSLETLLFDQPVVILLNGITGAIGYKPTGSDAWTKITEACGGSYDNPAKPSFPGECAIGNGTDTKIYTYHFTSFAKLEAVPSGSSSDTGSSSGSSSSGNTSGCSDAVAGSAPVLLSVATTGENQVTLNWSKAAEPVTHYVVVYGLASGNSIYGNPNVGGKDTASYTVKNLSGNTTYYFQVRAGNGCNAGPYSNELAATPGGEKITGPASGFSEGVLGTAIAADKEATPSAQPRLDSAGRAQPSVLASPQVKDQVKNKGSIFNIRTILVTTILILGGVAVFRFVLK